MTRRYDSIIVVDIECTCWERHAPPGEVNEIIEIGVCRLKPGTGERLDKRSLFIKPQRSSVSAFCTELTSITQAQVDKGMTFAEACSILEKEFKTRQRVWASYGDYDRQQFERQCRELEVNYPFSASHLNIKTLFTLIRGMKHDVGMAQAMEHLALPMEGRHHRGDDDAWNVALMLHLLLTERQNHANHSNHTPPRES